MPKINIVGARGKIADPKALVESLQALSEGGGLAMNADFVCGKNHLRSAIAHAERAFERGRNVSSTLAMETMLYASGERQISKATEKIGIDDGTERLAMILFDCQDADSLLRSLGLTRDDSVLESSPTKIMKFGISRREMEAVPEEDWPDLVLERVTFVELQKR